MAFQRKSFMYGVITGLGTYAILKWYCGRKRRKNIQTKEAIPSCSPLRYDHCILFNSTETSPCYSSLTNYCYNWFCSRCNYNYFLGLIKITRFSLDICVCMITSDEIAQIIFELFKRGVYIRIVMDKEMSQSRHSKLIFFMKNYIPIKLIEGKDGQIMHNKFVIIDREKLITGSFNWTESAFKKNFENGLVIYNKIILTKYMVYFESIWNPEVKFFS